MSTPKQLTAAERRRAIRWLKDAKGHIQDRRSEYVCYALQRAAQGDGHRHLFDHLINWIDEMLWGLGTLESWLYIQGDWRSHRPPCGNREIRLAWLDWMINELKEGR